MTHATPAPAPMGTVKIAAQPIVGMAASRNRQHADASSPMSSHRPRSSRREVSARPIPAPIPIPSAVIRMPNPAVTAPSEYWAKAGPDPHH